MADVLKKSFGICGKEADFISHYHNGGDLGAYIDLIESAQGHGFFVAHYLYGAIQKRNDRTLITQFRHPVPRILSCYQWVKRKSQKQNGDRAEFPDLETFVRASKGKRHSQIAQFGAGFGEDRTELLRLSNEELFERSHRALEADVGAISIAEYFEESIFLFAALCGLSHVTPWVRDQRNPGRILSHEADSNVVDLIKEYYRWDFALYDYALERFRKQLRGASFGPSLEKYRTACAGQYNDRILSPEP